MFHTSSFHLKYAEMGIPTASDDDIDVFVTNEDVYSWVSSYTTKLLLDLGTLRQYEKCHIRMSLPFYGEYDDPPLSSTNVRSRLRTLLYSDSDEELTGRREVVIIARKTHTPLHIHQAAALVKTVSREIKPDSEIPVSVLKSFESFAKEHPLLLTPSSEGARGVLPSLAAPNVYISGSSLVRNPAGVSKLRVGAVLNVAFEIYGDPDEFASHGLAYRAEALKDVSEQPLAPELLHELVRWVHEKVSAGQPTLVHCQMGISRSASVVIAYMLATQQAESVATALALLRRRRPQVKPNPGFMQRLGEYEEWLRTEKRFLPA